MRADVVGALELDRSDGGEQLLGPGVVTEGLLAAAAGHLGRCGLRRGQQLAEHGGPGTMHRGPRSRLDGFEVEGAAAAPAAEDHLEQLIYFLGDFLLDRFGRFFSWAVSVSSTGRAWQIFSLTSSSCRLSFRKR